MVTTNDGNGTQSDARKTVQEGGTVSRLPVRLRAAAVDPSPKQPRTSREEHPKFPLERRCTHQFEPFPLRFAQRAQQVLGESEDLELVASHRGLTLRAQTDAAIARALRRLRNLYGSQINVGPPTVRYHRGETLEEPWMGLRIRCSAEHVEAVLADLTARDVTNVTSQTQFGESCVQAVARLADLIDYSTTLDEISGCSAELDMWLSHYAPIPPSPPGGTAA